MKIKMTESLEEKINKKINKLSIMRSVGCNNKQYELTREGKLYKLAIHDDWETFVSLVFFPIYTEEDNKLIKEIIAEIEESEKPKFNEPKDIYVSVTSKDVGLYCSPEGDRIQNKLQLIAELMAFREANRVEGKIKCSIRYDKNKLTVQDYNYSRLQNSINEIIYIFEVIFDSPEIAEEAIRRYGDRILKILEGE